MQLPASWRMSGCFRKIREANGGEHIDPIDQKPAKEAKVNSRCKLKEYRQRHNHSALRGNKQASGNHKRRHGGKRVRSLQFFDQRPAIGIKLIAPLRERTSKEAHRLLSLTDRCHKSTFRIFVHLWMVGNRDAEREDANIHRKSVQTAVKLPRAITFFCCGFSSWNFNLW
ncbi:hypothetical protein [Tateyamaria sp.]|uniref:hypothetical protein n=1 Tax=Tateyamaria sp. TaxID=1929288 RepID=UPI00329C68D5